MFAMADICSSRLLASPPPSPASDWHALHHGPSASVVDQIGMSGTFMEGRGCGMWPCDRGDPDQRLTRKVRRLARELW